MGKNKLKQFIKEYHATIVEILSLLATLIDLCN